MNKQLTIKTKLLLSTLIIQAITLVFFGYGLYKSLEITTSDKIQSNLKIITLDIIDDITEHKALLKNIDLDEAEEFKFKPLYIRIIEPKTQKVIVTTHFPKALAIESKNFTHLKNKQIHIEEYKEYFISRTKIQLKKNIHLIVEIATTKNTLTATLENFLYILLLLMPVIFIISIVGTMILLNRSFKPVHNILTALQKIQATSLSKRLPLNHNNDEIDQLTQEINSLLNRLENSFEKVQQFTSDASHELKTPLTIIRGEIEVGLNKSRTKEEYEAILKTILEEVLIIQETTNDLLFLAQIEETSTKKECVYLDEIALDAVKELNSFANTQDVVLKPKIINAFQIDGYAQLLKISIKNILKNAITFSHGNSQVTLTSYILNNQYLICIQDTGIGLSKEDTLKVFEKFYRTDKSRNKYSGGTGLGLSICQKIIHMHEATISIESQENIGTTVTISFPIKNTNKDIRK